MGAFITPFFINKDREMPTNLDRNDVNAFDRWLMFPYNYGLDVAHIPLVSLSLASTMLPPLILGWGNQRGNFGTWLTYGVMFSQAFLFAYGINEIIAYSVNRYLPRMYFDGDSDFNLGGFDMSFPSTTASAVFMSATFLSVTFSQEFPNSRWRIPIIVGSYTLATGTAATRIFSGMHFATDVLSGAVIGSFFGWLIPTLHRRADDDSFSSVPIGNRLKPTGNGLIVSFRF